MAVRAALEGMDAGARAAWRAARADKRAARWAAATDRKARLQEAAEGRGVRLRVIVDCAFEALMTEKEQASLAFQVGGRGGC